MTSLCRFCAVGRPHLHDSKRSFCFLLIACSFFRTTGLDSGFSIQESRRRRRLQKAFALPENPAEAGAPQKPAEENHGKGERPTASDSQRGTLCSRTNTAGPMAPPVIGPAGAGGYHSQGNFFSYLRIWGVLGRNSGGSLENGTAPPNGDRSASVKIHPCSIRLTVSLYHTQNSHP